MNRRTALGSLATVVGGSGLSGCLSNSSNQTSQQTPTPIELSGTKLDDEGGMVIGEHGGPNGQIFYATNSPEEHENPAWFHTLTFGLFPYYFEHEDAGWEAEAIYVTDYSTVDYEVASTENANQISTHTAADTFGHAKTMTYVMESDVIGGMGPALIPFSADSDATSFVDEYGGRTVTFDAITPELIEIYLQS